MSVKVGLVGVKGAVGILIEVRDGQPTTVLAEQSARCFAWTDELLGVG